MKNAMYKMMLACLLVGLTVHAHAVMPGLALSQPKQVRGTVTEEGTGQPLVGASVYIKGTTDGTVTSATGAFEIAVTDEDAVLVFTYTGKKTEERPVRGLSVIDVVMGDDETMLQEVYIGYMTQRKADVTGSIAMATADDIAKNPSANAMKSLQGKLAGVHITTNGGNPAEGVTVWKIYAA